MKSFPLTAMFCLCALAARATEPPLRVAPGWDWSLHEGIQPVPYSGYISWGKGRFSDLITVQGVKVDWRQMCPAPDTYDWSPLLLALEKNKAAGLRR